MTNTTSIFLMITIVCLIWLIGSLMLMGLCRLRQPKWPDYPPLNNKKRLQKDREEYLRQQAVADYEARRQERRQRRAQRDRESLVSLSVR